MSYAILFFVLVLLDQITKALAYALEVQGIAIIPGYLEIDMLGDKGAPELNTGMSFGIAGDEPWAIPVFIAVTCVALVIFLIAVVKLPAKKRFLRVSIVFIMAGAAGNLIDRVVRGHVVDMFDFHWGVHHFPCFNVADAYITVAAAILVLVGFFPRLDGRRAKAKPPAKGGGDGRA